MTEAQEDSHAVQPSPKTPVDNVDDIDNIDSLGKANAPDLKSIDDAIIALSNRQAEPKEEDEDEDLSLSDFTDSAGSEDEVNKEQEDK